MGQSVYGLSQRETTLHCNVVSHWQILFSDRSLQNTVYTRSNNEDRQIRRCSNKPQASHPHVWAMGYLCWVFLENTDQVTPEIAKDTPRRPNDPAISSSVQQCGMVGGTDNLRQLLQTKISWYDICYSAWINHHFHVITILRPHFNAGLTKLPPKLGYVHYITLKTVTTYPCHNLNRAK